MEEEEEAAGAVPEEEIRGGCEKEKGLLLADAEEYDDDGCYEGIAEEAVEDLMRWLEAEIADDALPDPAAFVTINGNEESCGPSFSCAASTVMAAVDTRAGGPTDPPPAVPWPFPEPSAAPTMQEPGDEEMLADDDEAWLAELLACGPAALEGV